MLLTSLNSFVELFTALLIFAFVLVLTYFTTKFTAGLQKEKMKTANSEVVETARLANNKFILIIRTGNHYYSVISCKDSVTLLGELSPEELSLKEANEAKPQMDFSKLLEKAKMLGQKGGGNQN